mgnify:CR=1 FL=1
MTYKNRLLEKLNLPPRNKGDGSPSGNITEMMMDPRYLRQSATLVNEALQKGFDVLQLEDGEIVMTGTRTIVYRYFWDAEKGKLVKAESPVVKEEELASFEVEDA